MAEVTDTALAEAARRKDLVMALLRLMDSGHTQAEAAKVLGESAATLCRYRKAYDADGFDGLIPRHGRSGRKPMVTLTDEERRAVQRLVLQTDPTSGRSKQVSTSLAFRLYAQRPDCRPELAEAILKPRRSKHTLTKSLKRAARVTTQVKDRYRGEKTFSLNSLTRPRDLSYVDERGQQVPLMPGMLMEGDDMHFNEPFYVPWDDPADPCAERFGVRAFRAQLIPWIDVGSGRFVSYSMVLRHKDSYRAKDLRWSMHHLFHSVGLPKVLRLEHGAWSAKCVEEISLDQRLVEIRHANGPKSKFIENRFNTLQKLLSTRGVHVGRRRGEFEEENKLWTAVRQGTTDPRDVGFWALEDLTAHLEWALSYINTDPMEGRIYGPGSARSLHGLSAWVPDDVWSKHVGPDGLRRPTVEESWRIQPEIRDVSVRSGMVQCRSEEHGATYFFHHHRFAELGTHYRVRVAFDPANPTAGAAILNREPRQGARNREGMPENHLICVAEHVEAAPQFSLETNRQVSGTCRRYTQLCRMLYREIVPYGMNRPRRTVDHARDGRGNSAEIVRTGGRPSADVVQDPGSRDAADAVRTARRTREGVEAEARRQPSVYAHVDYA